MIHRLEATTIKQLVQDMKDFMRFGSHLCGRYAYSSPYILTKGGKHAVDLYFHDDDLRNPGQQDSIYLD